MNWEGGAIHAVLGGLATFILRLRSDMTGAQLGFSLKIYKPFVSVVAAGFADCTLLDIDIPRCSLLGSATTSSEEWAHCPSC